MLLVAGFCDDNKESIVWMSGIFFYKTKTKRLQIHSHLPHMHILTLPETKDLPSCALWWPADHPFPAPDSVRLDGLRDALPVFAQAPSFLVP